MIRSVFFLCALAGVAEAAPKRGAVMSTPNTVAQRKSRWLLDGLLGLSQRQPRRLVRMAEMLLAPDRVRVSTFEASRAFEWQHRLAMVSALSQLFDPSPAQKQVLGADGERVLKRARELLADTMKSDPSLLVRDGAVESVRRILRMRPSEAKHWKSPLETAFVDTKNHIDGEGLFIRETILTALREASLPLSPKMRRAAERDQNPQVRGLLRGWNTAAYDDL